MSVYVCVNGDRVCVCVCVGGGGGVWGGGRKSMIT